VCGIVLGVVAILTGGRAQRQGRTVEFSGGALTRLLRYVPISGGASAMTLGHVVIGVSPEALTRCRRHELVHVRQYEQWGPLFVPLYLAYGMGLWLRGRDAYRENPFEIEAERPE
jgi:hypothetical protein